MMLLRGLVAVFASVVLLSQASAEVSSQGAPPTDVYLNYTLIVSSHVNVSSADHLNTSCSGIPVLTVAEYGFGHDKPPQCSIFSSTANGTLHNYTTLVCQKYGDNQYRFQRYVCLDDKCQDCVSNAPEDPYCVPSDQGHYYESMDCTANWPNPEPPVNMIKLSFYTLDNVGCTGTERGWLAVAPGYCYYVDETDGWERIIYDGVEFVIEENCDEGCCHCTSTTTAAPGSCVSSTPDYKIDFGKGTTPSPPPSPPADDNHSTKYSVKENPYVWSTLALGALLLIAIIVVIYIKISSRRYSYSDLK
eukprot:TRINITY_DN345_c0_g3_i1.p1 TRINITY_DN345_c0_g3~~TRINITY_DN345_c0_g3_i1.p1  ORF type:complete len:304 (+),score=120.39 TRINITY_DN345_c0_g3_i1:118-1029(+)